MLDRMKHVIAQIREMIDENFLHLWGKRLAIVLGVLIIGLGFYFALRAPAILVDLAQIQTGPMSVTIQEEGETRVRDIYMVSSHIAGHLDRTNLDEGEAVKANKTIIASIHPLDPPFLDERVLKELGAAAEAAKSAVSLAEAELQRAQVNLNLAESEHQRAIKLFRKKVISSSQLEKSLNQVQVGKAQLQSQAAKVSLRKAELLSAQARLKQPRDVDESPVGKNCCIHLLSPIDGVVLKVHARSRQAVRPGAKIAEIGDPANLEIIVDLLSSDAPKVQPGSKVLISDWGGEQRLEAVVRRIDPAAFTKVSSLGIEEQRVNAVLDLVSVPKTLGHGYRVLANFIIWKKDQITKIPIAALFRSKGSWATFSVANGRAVLRQVEIGQMNQSTAQLISGVKSGDMVVLYPNDQLKDGSLVERRE